MYATKPGSTHGISRYARRMLRPKNALLSTSAIAMPSTNFSESATTVKIREWRSARAKRGFVMTVTKFDSPTNVASWPIVLLVNEIQIAVVNGQITSPSMISRAGASSTQPRIISCRSSPPRAVARAGSRAGVETPEEYEATSGALVLLVDLVELVGGGLERLLRLLVVADHGLEHARDHERRVQLGPGRVLEVRPGRRLALLRQFHAHLEPRLAEGRVVVLVLQRRAPLRLWPVVLVILLVIQEVQ